MQVPLAIIVLPLSSMFWPLMVSYKSTSSDPYTEKSLTIHRADKLSFPLITGLREYATFGVSFKCCDIIRQYCCDAGTGTSAIVAPSPKVR